MGYGFKARFQERLRILNMSYRFRVVFLNKGYGFTLGYKKPKKYKNQNK